jgi:hypothetical protein
VPNGLNVDIVAVHDLDESLEEAWTYIPTQETGTSKNNDLGSTGSSIERVRQQLEAQALTSEGTTKRRGSTKHSPLVPRAPDTASPEPAPADFKAGGGRESKEIDGRRTSESSQRSGQPFIDVDGLERKTHLFRDSNMIPASFPGARILSYTYPTLSSTTAHEYIDKVAEKLLQRLTDARGKLAINTVPLIFVGSGVGGLVLQKLLILAAAETDDKKNPEAAQILSMTAGLFFLDTPFPAIQQEEKTERPSFPSYSNTRQEYIMSRLKESGNELDLGALWDSFDKKRGIRDQKLPIVWLHTSIAKDSSKVYQNAGTIRGSCS